ncbi:MAG: DUF7453 family protein [Phycisphaerales bacterium]
MRTRSCVALIALASPVGPVLADPAISVVALSGTPAPGAAGAVYQSFSHNIVLGHRPGFLAAARDADNSVFNGIWGSATNLTPQLFAREGGTAPGTSGGIFQSLAGRDPHVRGTTTLFSATLTPGIGDVTILNTNAIFRLGAFDSTSPIIARVAGNATPAGAIFSTIGTVTPIDFTTTLLGIPAFNAVLANGPGGVTEVNNAGVWGQSPTTMSFTMLDREFDFVNIPGRPSARFTSFSQPVLTSAPNASLFRCTVTFIGAGGTTEALLLLGAAAAAPSPGQVIATIGGMMVGNQSLIGGATVSAINSFALGGGTNVNQQSWAVVVTGSNGATHIYNQFGRLFSTDIAASGVRFSNFDAPVLSPSGDTAFRGRLSLHPAGISTTTDDCLVFVHTALPSPNDPVLVAREGSQAPGCPDGTLFDIFSLPNINSSGAVTFVGTLRAGTGDVTAANNRGIWCWFRPPSTQQGDPTLRLILRNGQQIELAPGDIRTIQDFNILTGSGTDDGRRSSFADSGALAVWARFTDGVEAVLTVQAAPATAISFPTRLGNVVYLRSGDTVSGASLSNGFALGASARIITSPQPPAIYRHRLVLTADFGQVPDGKITGLPQQDGAVQSLAPSATPNWPYVQAASAFTPTERYNQWYGFGRSEIIPWIGTAPLMGTYVTGTLHTQVVTPTNLGQFRSGPLTITTVDQGNTFVNTELLVYDATLHPIPDAINDDAPASSWSTLNRNFTSGVYFLAVSNAPTACNLPNPPTDAIRNTPVMEYPDALVNGSAEASLPLNFAVTDANGVHPFTATKTEPFEVLWFRFTVAGAICNVADVAGLGGAMGPDGQNTPDDLIAFLDAFFAGNLAIADIAGLGGSPTSDGQLTVDDLIRFLDQFFSPCQ